MAVDLVERIRSVPLFSGFGDKDLERVAAIAKEVEFPAGREIARQGESGDIALGGDPIVAVGFEGEEAKGRESFGLGDGRVAKLFGGGAGTRDVVQRGS